VSCPICESVVERGRPPDAVVELPTAWVTTGWPSPLVPGYAGVVYRDHIVEPYELDDQAGAEYWLDVMRTARALAAITQPRKLNYEIHGNTIPHLHTHLLPRDPRGDVDPARVGDRLRAALA
jgi:diadenosine tetraphosphate (Ap4A) HIT family hydrolase